MKLLVGLGNPGRQYEKTRHNIGFMVLDALAAELDLSINKKQGENLIAQGFAGQEKVLLAKPQSYMNLSGGPVLELLNYYRDSIDDLIIIHDDLDLEFGRLRFRPGGGSGGHKGIKSIIQILNSPDFDRLRIGIGRPPDFMKVENYVLSTFTPEEWGMMPELLKTAVEGLKMWSAEGIAPVMNRYNAACLMKEQEIE